jgi:hypothetical protein
VIERGSTETGDYVRFADGTQICTATLTATGCTTAEGALFASNTETWTFPVAFAAPPSVSGSGGSTGRFVGANEPSTSQVVCKVLSTTSDATILAPSLAAIGRWF